MENIVELIQHKRDGGELPAGDIEALIAGYMSGEVADYQMSAWLMAAFLRGLTLAETLALTGAIIASGDTLDLSGLGRRVVDKHSTGGVGDKVSLVLGPLVASCGAVFGKMSGRSLGHTGGTVDKLESIPGFRTGLEVDHFVAQLREVGVCIAGQTVNLAPADGRLYALRDVTATIDSNPLTAASIMSKKIAGGAQAVVLDIKVGRGAFFTNMGQARGVAHLMEEIGRAHGMEVVSVMTAMEQPLGHAVGNSLEVLEAVEALAGRGPADLAAVVVELAANLLALSDLGWDRERSREEAGRRLSGGEALPRFRRWVEAQGGDASFIDDPGRLPLAPHRLKITAPADGYVSAIDALAAGKAAFRLGAGRRRKGDAVNHGVGLVLHAKVGDRVGKGEAIASVYAGNTEAAGRAAGEVAAAYELAPEPVPAPPVIIG